MVQKKYIYIYIISCKIEMDIYILYTYYVYYVAPSME